MMMKEVEFTYCETCKHHCKPEYEEPCETCLDSSYNEDSKKPMNYEEAEK